MDDVLLPFYEPMISYERVASGLNSVEPCLYDEMGSKIQLGDLFVFSDGPDEQDAYCVHVDALLRYPSLASLLDDVGPSALGMDSTEEAVKAFREWYPLVQELRYGVLGVKISLAEELVPFALLSNGDIIRLVPRPPLATTVA